MVKTATSIAIVFFFALTILLASRTNGTILPDLCQLYLRNAKHLRCFSSYRNMSGSLGEQEMANASHRQVFPQLF